MNYADTDKMSPCSSDVPIERIAFNVNDRRSPIALVITEIMIVTNQNNKIDSKGAKCCNNYPNTFRAVTPIILPLSLSAPNEFENYCPLNGNRQSLKSFRPVLIYSIIRTQSVLPSTISVVLLRICGGILRFSSSVQMLEESLR